MNELLEKALSRYPINNAKDRQNALYEITQQVVLAGLHRGGFFDRAAFYGGTCLRLFHGLPRFSEDMDFSLLQPDDAFQFENYFQPIIDEFDSLGRTVEIKKKEKKPLGRVESAFLKDNTDVCVALKQRLSTTNIEDVKTDVRGFLCGDTHELDVWSNDYFLQLADMIIYK